MPNYNIVDGSVPVVVVSSAGIRGIQGTTGTQGAQGVTGPQGVQGTQGIQGLTGIQGATGTQGTQGTQGATGTQGTTGIQGAIGTQGTQGLQGTEGAQGLEGTQGTQGVQGLGIQGASGTSVVILGSYPTYQDLVAAHPTGNVGDGYIVDADGDLYVWSENTNSWVSAGQIQGPQGTTGAQGIEGAQGFEGAQGTTGTQGITGGPSYIVNYLDGGNATPNTDIIYDAGNSNTQSWTYTIDAGASVVSF